MAFQVNQMKCDGKSWAVKANLDICELVNKFPRQMYFILNTCPANMLKCSYKKWINNVMNVSFDKTLCDKFIRNSKSRKKKQLRCGFWVSVCFNKSYIKQFLWITMKLLVWTFKVIVLCFRWNFHDAIETWPTKNEYTQYNASKERVNI